MLIPARILRAFADELRPNRPVFTTRDLDQRDRILATGRALMVRHGRAGITLGNFALAMRMSPSTIRRFYPDIDCLLAEILTEHLRHIAAKLGEVPMDLPDRRPAMRAAYLAATRGPFGTLTETHRLLMRDRYLLPPDLAEPLETLRLTIGDILAGENAEIALALLDMPQLDLAQIEAALAAVVTVREAQPAPKPPLRVVAGPEPVATPATPARQALPDPNTARRPRAGPH